jgi:hypothetical protein
VRFTSCTLQSELPQWKAIIAKSGNKAIKLEMSEVEASTNRLQKETAWKKEHDKLKKNYKTR